MTPIAKYTLVIALIASPIYFAFGLVIAGIVALIAAWGCALAILSNV